VSHGGTGFGVREIKGLGGRVKGLLRVGSGRRVRAAVAFNRLSLALSGSGYELALPLGLLQRIDFFR
jgi:hypothetical protein